MWFVDRTTAVNLPDAGSIPQSPDDMSRNLKSTENIPQFLDTPKSAMSIAERWDFFNIKFLFKKKKHFLTVLEAFCYEISSILQSEHYSAL